MTADASTTGSRSIVPPDSDAFAVVAVEEHASLPTAGDGDLWPSAWADDDALYAACGDGLGFADGDWSDILVNRIDGTPATGLSGERLSSGRDVAPVWTDPSRFNSKPTGMVAVDGNGDGRDELYLAVQDLRHGATPDTFNTAPAAGIVRSDDYGRTWHHGAGPMFTGEMTTLMFLDLGRSSSGAKVLRDLVPPDAEDPAGFVYAYGLDHNWRTSYSGVVPDPEDLYLARVRVDAIQDRASWRFFAGLDGGAPLWSAALAERVPVLTDTRRTGTGEPVVTGPKPVPGSVLAQGGVVYNAPLRRFLYTSWTEFTFEFYEAPTPWGPWRRILTHDFGPFPWRGPLAAEARHGGYATTVPSKFISADGREAWVQSNWFVGASTYGGSSYGFSLRRLRLEPMPAPGSPPHPVAGGSNLAALPQAQPFATACRSGQLGVLVDGRSDRAEDSWNGVVKEREHWGVAWPFPVVTDAVEYTTGPFDNGSGWFVEPPQVEVRDGAGWRVVDGTTIEPAYPCSAAATGRRTFTFRFPAQVTTGIRIAGRAGGWGGYTSIAELVVRAAGTADGTTASADRGSITA
ncbi:DUF4185 domain-containing protein [Pseudactinotalea suaedae]|uniref:DUF4185 domain-containing protein n=1 Tax=Pseudactinotalea suaedae TaxID=1524924 RepID=UPI0012E1ABD0|nr:DUF4185 domain-containing protein [Pseudactinotalea suaedae]